MKCVQARLTQSVTNLFVEFLLSEVERAKAEPAATKDSDNADAPTPGEPAAESASFDLHSLSDLDRSLRRASEPMNKS